MLVYKVFMLKKELYVTHERAQLTKSNTEATVNLRVPILINLRKVTYSY